MLHVPAISWTDDRIELLKGHFVAGKSAAQIADLIGGTTRNAVIGKIHRLGLNINKLLTEDEIATRFARQKEAKRIRDERASRRVIRFGQPRLPQVSIRHDDLSANAKHVSFMDLEDRHCRFAYGTDAKEGYTFCGHDKDEGSSYCADHRSICCVAVSMPTPRSRKYFGTDFGGGRK